MSTPKGTEYLLLLEKLRYIQTATGIQMEIPSGGLDDEDMQDIREMYAVITEGRVEFQQRELTLEFNRQTMRQILQAVQRGQGVTYTSSGGDSLITLLDTDVPLGPANFTISFVPLASESELRDAVQAMRPKDAHTLKVRVVTGYVTYAHWPKK